MVLDAHGNESGASRAAMNLLAKAGIGLRTNAASARQNDHQRRAERGNAGSFNYSTSAAKANSENALVLWGFPAVASVYLEHWQSRWEQGQPYQPTF